MWRGALGRRGGGEEEKEDEEENDGIIIRVRAGEAGDIGEDRGSIVRIRPVLGR